MSDAENKPKKPDIDQLETAAHASSPPVPQITLTEAVDSPSDELDINNQQQASRLTPSPNSLSQTLGRTAASPNNSFIPLPLTRDLLQRKNKLDKLLHNNNNNNNGRKRSQQQQQKALPIMTFSSSDSNIAVDERVTAGLGISTPTSRRRTSIQNLRNRRSSTSANITDENPLQSPTSIEHPAWNYYCYMDQKSISNSTSIMEHMIIHPATTITAASHSASSSIYSIISNKKKMYHREKQPHQQHMHAQQYTQPHYPESFYRSPFVYHHQQENRALQFLFSAASRVINLRGLERRNSLNIAKSDSLLQRSPSIVDNKSPRYSDPIDTEDWCYYAANRYPTQHSDLSKLSEKRSIWSHASSPIFHVFSRTSYSDLPPAPEHESRSSTIPEKQQSDPTNFAEEEALQFHPPNPLHGKTLGLFSPENPVRLTLWKNVIGSRYVELFLLFVLCLHYFLLVCVPIYENKEKTVFGGQWTHYVILVIQIIYSLEALCKIVVYGLWIPPYRSGGHQDGSIRGYMAQLLRTDKFISAPIVHEVEEEEQANQLKKDHPAFYHKAYISGVANVLDLVSIVSYWIDFGLMLHEYPYCSLFKAMGALRPLRLLSILQGTATIMRSLEVSWGMLKDVIGFIFFFLLLFALIGLTSFKGVFSRRCYVMEPDGQPSLVDPPLYCSGYYNGTQVTGAYNPSTNTYSNPGYKGYLCESGQVCLEITENNPDYGFVNYDTIYYAFLSVYTTVSLELWTELMYNNMDGDSAVVALYYCLSVYVISFIMLFLIFAVITSGFSRVRAESKVSAFTGKKKKHRMLRPAHMTDDQEELVWRYEDPEHDPRHLTTRLRFKRLLTRFAKSTAFFYLGGLLVLLDIAFMCLRSAHASDDTLEMIDNAETAFTFLFALEILIRMLGAVNWMKFWMSTRNKFDLFLVIVTCIIQLPMIQDSAAYKYLTIFQCLRIYRLFICIPRVRRLVAAALGNGESVINVVIFLLLATALCVPIFMQLFGGDFGFIGRDETELRCDTFWESFLTLTMIYTSETWTEFLYNAMASQPNFSAVYAAIFTCGYLAFARYIMSGLYIAVILENFELEDEEIKRYQIRQFIQRKALKSKNKVQSFLDRILGPLYIKSDRKQVHLSHLPSALTAAMNKNALTDMLSSHQDGTPSSSDGCALTEEPKASKLMHILAPWSRDRKTNNKSNSREAELSIEENNEDYELIVEEENRRAYMNEMPELKSLFLFSSQNRFRRWCKVLAGSSADGRTERRNLFNWFITACVVASTLIVILDEPSTRVIRMHTLRQTATRTVDMVLSTIFVVEIFIRVVADGLILPPNAYLRNSWNRLDFTVVVLNFVVHFASDGSDLSRAVGTVRSLRILRLIRYFSGMRDVFVDLFYAFPLMLDALLLVFLVMIFFSIYGVNMLGGRMITCNDDSVSGRNECVGEFQNDVGDAREINILQPRVWALPDEGLYSFDDFPAALAQLFSLSSTEGWIDSLFLAMSAPSEPDVQPEFSWDSPAVYHSIFYVIFMIVSHGTLQLFVGVIIEKFKQRAGITTMTTTQRQYADLRRQLAEIKPTPKVYRPNTRIRRWCYDLVANKRGAFTKVMMGIIILNICVIATEYQNSPGWLVRLQDAAYLTFIIVFILESIIKYLGLGWRKWSKSKWNWFNAFIAISAFVLMMIRFWSLNLWVPRIERYCLVIAAFRLGEGIDALQTLYHTVRISLPNIVHVTAVFLLVMCIFAMIFMELFGLTKYGSETGNHSNFRDYGNALLLLIRITTGEAWNVIMMDYTVQPPSCVYSDNYLYTDCGSPGWAYFLFNFFYLICTHIFLNLFTATVISNFEYTYETRSRFTRLRKEDLRNFKFAWSEVDPNGTGYMQKEDVAKFLHLLDGRFRIRIYDDMHSIKALQRIAKKGIMSPQLGNEKPVDNSVSPQLHQYNIAELNQCLSRINPEELQKRRKEYNLYYLEIISAATSKGISFDDVRTILSYRFLNIEDALTIDPLIERLEKLDQLNKAYAAEKARGIFLTMAQRKRYLHQLWQKRNEDELRKLSVPNKTGLHLDTSAAGLIPRSPTDRSQKSSPVPTIVIEDAPPSPGILSDYVPSPASLTVPVSPMSNYSLDTMYGSPIRPAGGDSLSVTFGTNNSLQNSPCPTSVVELDDNASVFNNSNNVLSPHSPTVLRQNWQLVVDGNSTNITPELAASIMESLEKNFWSEMLHEEGQNESPSPSQSA